jgi:glutamate dehydrogenase (NADP+)
VQAAKLQFKSLDEIIATETTFTSQSTKCEYLPGARPWIHVGAIDIALPCATQNEVSGDEAKALVAAGCKFIAEGSNMGSTQEAIDVFEAERKSASNVGSAIWYAPGKAANCGGVAVSGLEMAQNSQRESWTREEVDAKLKDIMVNCFDNCYETSIAYSSEKNANSLPSLVMGANVAGFVKVADAMKDQGDWW